MRIKSNIWVAAYLRRCQTENIFGVVRRRGAEEAGAIFIKLALLDGNAVLFTPAPQTAYDQSRPTDRVFLPTTPAPVAEQVVEDRLAKEIVSIPTSGSSRSKTAPDGTSLIWRKPKAISF